MQVGGRAETGPTILQGKIEYNRCHGNSLGSISVNCLPQRKRYTSAEAFSLNAVLYQDAVLGIWTKVAQDTARQSAVLAIVRTFLAVACLASMQQSRMD
jgi:hypothetical protein